MKREWITRKGLFVPPALTGRIVIAGPGKRSTDAPGTKAGEITPGLRVRDGHGGKTSLAVCGALSAQRLRLALAAGDCTGAGSGGRGQKGSTQNSVLAAEGAVLFLEKVSPALEHVHSSSGAIGNAINRAIEELVPVIATARADF
jgi:hypothetical protein